ncbi:MAG: diguanylate cyclase [Betaproteobacteria bacterium]|nr:diguanylate cyclase [Betaproteobacteria bacterium]
MLVAIVGVLVAVAIASMEFLAATTAYMAGESLWSKAQKDAMHHLVRYTATRDEADFRAYRKRIAVTLGDRAARIELEKPRLDREAAYRGLLQGGNHPDDLARLAMVFRWFRHAPYISEAIDIWAEGDRLIAQMDDAAMRLRGGESAARTRPVLDEIHALNDQLTLLEIRFSAAIGEAARFAQRALSALVLFTGLASLLGGGLLLRRIVAYDRKIQRQQALEESEARLSGMLRDAPYAIVISRLRDGALLYTNRRAREQTRVPSEVRSGQLARSFYADPGDRAQLVRQALEGGVTREREIELKDYEGRRFWALMSGRAIRYENEDCLLVSFTDITERRNAALRQELQASITALLADADAVEEAVQGVIRNLCQTLNFACGARWIVDAQANLLRCLETWGAEEPAVNAFLEATRNYAAPPRADGGGIVQQVWRGGTPIWVEDIGRLATFRRGLAALAAGLASVLAFPILLSGGFFGVLELYAREKRPRDEDLLRLAHDLGSQIGQFLARKAAEEKLRFGAYHDPLTGLANRAAFVERLEQTLALAQRHHRQVALLFIDLDGFKPVNDTLGHGAGDAVLKEIAARLRSSLRAGDVVGRMGGDEFVVLVEESGEPERPAKVARKLLDAVARPVPLAAGQECRVTASIGISRYPEDGEDAGALLRSADEAMYRSKAEGRNAFRSRSA